jgi:N-acetylglucosaminyldiphosphoundecaprenol N-acetyl-beta-D-mannosaminyltransferase
MRTRLVIGFPVAATCYEDAVSWVVERARRSDAAYAVSAANTHVMAMARSDTSFGKALSRFDLICPDGMPLVWSVNAGLPKEQRLRDRVYGPTLMLHALERSQGQDHLKHFLLGGRESTLDKLSVVFAERFPGTHIAGSYSPPFGEWPDDEFDRICGKITASGANMIWVGLGCPKQELWIGRNKDKLPPGVYFSIGAAFAFHAGEVAQAPACIQRYGLEWAYRLFREPRRLFRRYFTYNSLFLYYTLRDRIAGGNRNAPETSEA